MSNNALNSKEALEDRTATSSSVMLSGARRVKEADALDITHYIRDPGNSHRLDKLMQIWGALVSLWKRERETRNPGAVSPSRCYGFLAPCGSATQKDGCS